MLQQLQQAMSQPISQYTFTLSLADVKLIGEALSDRPYKEVAGILQRLQTAITAQEAAARAKQTKEAEEAAAKEAQEEAGDPKPNGHDPEAEGDEGETPADPI